MTATINRRATRVVILAQAGDDLVIPHSWNRDVSGYTITATAGDEDFTVDIGAYTNGRTPVVITLTAAQTTTLGAGSHEFTYEWDDDDGLHRHVFTGSVDLV